MILGIGIDLVEIARIRRSLERFGDRFLQRCFTPAERERALKASRPERVLAMAFAAKEAFAKATGLGMVGIGWREIELGRLSTGQPTLSVSGRALSWTLANRVTAMQLVSAAQMREMDRLTIEEIGLPGIVLMENAAQGAARVVQRVAGPPQGLKLAAICGRGNNGGDALAVARILANQGAEASAYLLAKAETLRGDAATNLAVARACGVRIVEVEDDRALEGLGQELGECDVILDGMLGTGLNSPVRGLYARAVQLLNSVPTPVVAIDIPSGLSADTGRPLGASVRATATATFGLMKQGLALEYEGYCGEVEVVDISIPPSVVERVGVNCWLATAQMVQGWLPPRPPGAHKGSFGHVLVVGGAPGTTGAALLAAMGAIRAGAGLVSIGLPASLNIVVETALTPAMSQPLAETSEGVLAESAAQRVVELMDSRQCLVIGPGMGKAEESARMLAQVLERYHGPIVVDADGLNLMASSKLAPASAEAVLTPHPGEAARLLGTTAAEIQNDRLGAARTLAAQTQAVVVLKGAKSVVAAADGRAFVIGFANPLLATGGSGDVLAGIIGGLMAQGLGALEAASAGAYVHGLAAHLGRAKFGLRGMSAPELVDLVVEAFRELEDGGAGDTAQG